ncbi:HAMP domain-containing sensor histidine kinase [Chryseobacterium sp. Bi04]|uniref:sensor histidine kinase n=1 Tax=Chryseobacterium sp. Bi04 TaxID=2822345 RepID=UPI001DF17414|nr:HAMP domain-containing sensor histidine kinase [Chryseobacterium sp. Bi04]CAH0211238.1 Autoinducer 2 sensor kinase/phosphatase LuxQ [Chryseobacterium sp. Bi04]
MSFAHMRAWVVFFAFLYLPIYGQRYTSTWYNIDNGLPQSSAKAIAKDKYGFIWISTENGLVRYDGISFVTFNNFKINSLHFGVFIGDSIQDTITTLTNSQEDKIIIKNRFPRLSKLNPNDRVSFSKGDQQIQRIANNTISSSFYNDVQYFIQLKNSKYIFREKNAVIYKDEKGIETRIAIPFTNEDLNNIFVLHENLFINDLQTRKTYSLCKGKLSVFDQPSLFNDPETKIYWQQITNQSFIINKSNIYLVEDSRNRPSLKFLVTYKEIGSHSYYSMYYGKNFNNLYLGTLNNGLNIVHLSNIHVARKEDDFSNNVSNASLPFSKNTIITEDGTEFGKDGIVNKYAFGNNDNSLMMYDNSGNILIRKRKSIIRFYKNSGYKKKDSTFFKLGFENFMKSGNLYALSLLNSSRYQLQIFKKDQFTRPDYIYSFKSPVTTFLQYNENQVLAGNNEGLHLVMLDKNTVHLLIKNISVKSIVKTKDNLIWIMTHKNGFYLFKDRKLIKMPNDRNNYLQSAHSILEDQQGFYWISSNNGLYKVPKKQLLQYAENRKSPVFYYRFTKKDGFTSNEFNGNSQPNAYALENGEFMFPSMDGFVFFNPVQVQTYYPDPKKIYIERAKIGHAETLYFDAVLDLKNDYKTADIFIDIPYFSDFENLYIEAKISGEEESDWEAVTLGKDLKYTISNLSPGEYTLKVRVLASADGKYEEKAVKFRIQPYFFQTLLFKILLSIIFLVGIIIIIMLTTNLLRTKNKALKRIVHNKNSKLKETSLTLEVVKNDLQKETEYQKKLVETISHDITTPIRFIAMLSQKLHESDDVELQKKYFDSIYKSSEQLYQFTLNLKEYTELYKAESIVEEQEYPVNRILEIKKKLFWEIAKERETVIINATETNVNSRMSESILSAIIHNILDNAVKNTYKGEISLNIIEDEQKVVIIIDDTGTGMSAEQIAIYMNLFKNPKWKTPSFKGKGLGLHMVIHLVKKINAEISFSQNFPKGTIVEITLKKN